MLAKRIIPCLDVRGGKVVKGKNFLGVRDIAEPEELAEYYSRSGADELVFYDITASYEERKLFTEVLSRVAAKVSIPLSVGGGVNTTDDFSRLLSSGADKVSVNSGAIKNPDLISKAAEKFGSQCVVLSMDVARHNDGYAVYSHGGREVTDLDAIKWAKMGQSLGAGEIVINSIDADGVKGGFDIEMTNAIASAVTIPIIASGGAGKKEDFLQLFNASPLIDAGLAASVFHYKEINIEDLKKYLKASGVEMRI